MWGSQAIANEASSKYEHKLSKHVRDRYRCAENSLDFALGGELSSDQGYFQFAADCICYGRSCSGVRHATAVSPLYDVLGDIVADKGKLRLPFDPTEIIDNLRLERYSGNWPSGSHGALKRLYYLLRPLSTPFLRRQIKKFQTRNWQKLPFPRWPVDTTVESICETLLLLSLQASGAKEVPFVWFWPRGARGCVMMTHDVDTQVGRDFCADLLDIDDAFGIKASFQIVPEGRYAVRPEFLNSIRSREFEVAVQDLNHDGRLFDDREEFRRRVARINRSGKEYGARGFRAAVLYRKPEWYSDLEFSFDMSIPNVAHLDPQRGGCCTVMPYFIGEMLELPVTMVQDYTLFHLLDQRSISLWKSQIRLVLEKHGLLSFIVHPDYIRTSETKALYEELLRHLEELRDIARLWCALPHEVDTWWRMRNKMVVTKDGNRWRIEGEGSEQAVLAFAKNLNGKLVYELADSAAFA